MTDSSSVVVTVPGQPSHIGELNKDYWELLQPDDEATTESHVRADPRPDDDNPGL